MKKTLNEELYILYRDKDIVLYDKGESWSVAYDCKNKDEVIVKAVSYYKAKIKKLEKKLSLLNEPLNNFLENLPKEYLNYHSE